MAHLINDRGLDNHIEIDSAGTIATHAGERADSRMRDHAKRRGIELLSRSRKFEPNDFEKFDYIVVMDNKNFTDITSLDSDGRYAHKIHKMTDFCQNRSEQEVPDPYWGGAEGFEQVLDIVEDGAKGLLEELKLGK